MAFRDIPNIAALTRQIPPAEDIPMEPVAANDTGIWKDIVNLRLKQDNGYPQWKARGGSQSVDSSLNSIAGGIIHIEAFSTQIAGSTVRFMMIQSGAGSLLYKNMQTAEVRLIIDGESQNGAQPLSQVAPVRFLVNGRLVYIFDGDTEQNKVYNIETEVLTDFGSLQGGRINSAEVADFEPNADGWPEQNVFGFAKGRALVSIPSSAQFVPIGSTIRRDQFLFQSVALWIKFDFDPDRETLLRSDGTEIDSTGLYFIGPGVGIKATNKQGSGSVPSTGDAPQVSIVRYYREGVSGISVSPDAENLFSPRVATVDGFEEKNSVKGLMRIREDGKVWFPFSGTSGSSFNPDRVILPRTTDTEELLDGTGFLRYNEDTNTIESNPDFDSVILYRAYAIVQVAADGSVSLPGPPVVVTVDASDILTNFLAYVDLDIPTADSGVENRFLIATRWHLNERNLFMPSSERNPNGTWFIHSEISAEAQPEFRDDKPDTDLTRPLTELLPINAGIINQFAAGEVRVHTAAQHKGTLFVGGYDIVRQSPEDPGDEAGGISRNIVREFRGNTDIEVEELFVQFEYVGGLYSAAVPIGSYAADDVFRMYNLNTLVERVVFYRNIIGTELTSPRQVITREDPEFNGAAFTPSQVWPLAMPKDETSVTTAFADRILPAIPFQQFNIANQAQIADGSRIRAVVPMVFDRDKSTMRFQLLVQTENNIQTGYIVEQFDGQRTTFLYDFETANATLSSEDGSGTTRIDNSVFISGRYGVWRFTPGSGFELVIDRERYPEANRPISRVVHHTRENEIWVLFRHQPGERVRVHAITAEGVRFYDYENTAALPRSLTSLDGKLYTNLGGALVETDVTGLTEDRIGTTVVNTVKGECTSRPLTSSYEQLGLVQLRASGDKGLLQPSVDTQPARRQQSAPTWQAAFEAGVTLDEQPLAMYETVWYPGRQIIRPQIRFRATLEAEGFIELITMRVRRARNQAKAKEE